MKRRDARSRYVIIWLAVMLLAGLVGWLLRGPVCTLPPMLSAIISDNQDSTAVYILTSIGAALYALAAVMIVVAVIVQGLRHKIYKGPRYALRHWLMWRNIRKALLDAGYGIHVGEQYYRLPHVKIQFDNMPTMGVCVRYSAHAYAVFKQEYRQRFQVEMNIAAFLRMVQDDIYTTRLSRIDLTADYFDYEDELLANRQLSPDSIFKECAKRHLK